MRTVLIVDDEHSQAEVVAMLLRMEGFEVAIAVNGQEAVTRLDAIKPVLIITDYMMPVMNGGEMVQFIRTTRTHSRIPIVMTSATDERQIGEYGHDYDAFLRKPYLWDDLFTVIKRLLADMAVPQSSQ